MVRAGGRSWASALSSAAHASYLLTSLRASLPVWMFMSFIMKTVSGYECGGFVKVGPETGAQTITSPNYPGYTRCIWIVEAEAEHLVKVTVTLEGESRQGDCTDLVQFRDGGETSQLLAELCGNMRSRVVQSTGQWMYIFFKSNEVSSAHGFQGVVVAQFAGSTINKNITAPYSDCRSYEFTCSNKLCLSMSYRCDGYYDCGCGSGCDEVGCEGLSIDNYLRIVIGVSVGLVTFVLVTLLGMALERGHHWDKQDARRLSIARARSLAGRKGEWTASRNRSVHCNPSTSRPTSPPSPSCRVEVSEIA